jgi:phage baseplate assembly protein W
MDLGMNVPSNYAQPGFKLLLKDVDGHWQRMQVKSVSGTRIEFYETFSQNFTAPIKVVRLENLSSYGMFDGEVSLTAPVTSGQRTMALSAVKDIYIGYVLYVMGESESRAYVVESVNYLNKTVRLTEASLGFAAGAKVRIYNRETHQMHLAPGIELKVPLVSGDENNHVQTAGEVYGTDIATDESGLLKVYRGGFALVTGLDNLKQAIEHRIVTNYESLLVHPRYGCGLLTIIGKKATPAVRSLAKAALIDALNREPRLNRIATLTYFSVGDVVKFAIGVAGAESNTASDLNFVIGGN